MALLLALASGLLFGVVPVRQIMRSDPWQVIRTGMSGAAGHRRFTARDILLAVQIAICAVLVTSSLVAVRGLAMIMADGSPVSWRSTRTHFNWVGTGTLLKVPITVWLFVMVFLVAALVLRYTSFGRYIYAIGDSRESARLCGINVRRIEITAYMIMGFLSALAAVVYISRLEVGEPTAGTGIELDAIAMVVIGGTSTFGGEGGVKGTLVGAAIIAVLANLLNLLGISPFIQQVVKGVIIVFAVLIERQRMQKGGTKGL